MMMLPAPQPMHEVNQLATCLLPRNVHLGEIFPDFQRNYDGQIGRIANFGGTVIGVDQEACSDELVLVSDALIVILDGNIGVSARLIQLWELAREHDVPRIIGVLNPVVGRADFHEVVAIVNRVFNEDILARYEVIENDVSTHAVALFDLLLNVIIDYSSGHASEKVPEMEHLELTSDNREALIEEVAHVVLSDESLRQFTANYPVAMSKIVQAWDSDAITSIVPIDGTVGIDVLQRWLLKRVTRWVPTIRDIDGKIFDVSQANQPVGIGICDGMARMWNNFSEDNSKRTHEFTVHKTSHNEAIELASGAIVRHSSIELGDTVRLPESQLLIFEPRF